MDKRVFREPMLEPREEKIQQTIRCSMNRLLEAQMEQPISIWEFLYCQSRYIRKQWWGLQALLLLGLYAYVQTLTEAVLIRQALGVGAPLFIILVIPELWKNQSSNAMDIESATMYTLRQVYSARLTLFAGVDLLLLTAFILGSTLSQMLTFGDLLTQFILPVNVTCCICLTCLYSSKADHQTFSLAMCLVFAGVWKEMVRDEKLYDAITCPIWCVLLSISFAYIVYVILRGQSRWRNMLEKRLLRGGI